MPLAPIPSTFPFFRIEGSRFEYFDTERLVVNDRFPITQQVRKIIYLPEVDDLGTKFLDEKLPLSFTKDLIDYESERGGMLSSRSNSDTGKFGWKADIIKLFTGESGGEINLEYQKQLSAASSYWLGRQENKVKIGSIENDINNKYRALIANVIFQRDGQTRHIELFEARNFIAKFNQFIQDSLNQFFEDARKMNNYR